MIITDVKCYVVEEELNFPSFNWRKGVPGGFGDGTPTELLPRFAYVKVETDSGIAGWTRQNRGDVVASIVLRRFKSLIGHNALMTEKLWSSLWGLDRVERFQVNHIGIMDSIAWDIKSKAAGMPLHKLLGGNETRIPAYASTVTWDSFEEYERHIKMCIDVGFTAFKLHAWGDVKQDAELCRRLRKWTGDDAVLTFDASGGWTLEESLKFGRILEDLDFYWFEEPILEFDMCSYTRLCDALDIPVLAAETTEGSYWNTAAWMQAGALDMARTSSFLKGGITGAIKIAHLAEAFGMKAQVHGMGPAQAQIAAAIPNNDFYEQIVYSEEQINALSALSDVPVVDGYALVSEEPGLEPEPDWRWLEKNAVAVV